MVVVGKARESCCRMRLKEVDRSCGMVVGNSQKRSCRMIAERLGKKIVDIHHCCHRQEGHRDTRTVGHQNMTIADRLGKMIAVHQGMMIGERLDSTTLLRCLGCVECCFEV